MSSHHHASRPSRNFRLHPGINFSSLDVGGDIGGFVFAAGSVIAVLVGLPELAPLYLGSLAAGLLFAYVLHGWLTR
jgi:tetrahydromethanopterin S-methyltransferase subunit F